MVKKSVSQKSRILEPYTEYLAREWEMFAEDPSRQEALLDAASGHKVETVLDIGCGAGQEMLPFVSSGAQGFGMDLSQAAGHVLREMYTRADMTDKARFIQASGTNIPFPDDYFDVVICRGALMYMDNRMALSEIWRVLKCQGVLLLKYHEPGYYWKKLKDGIVQWEPKSSVHAARVLLAGYFYYFTGRQPFNRITAKGEIFQTGRTIQRELSLFEASIRPNSSDSNVLAPSLIITKH